MAGAVSNRTYRAPLGRRCFQLAPVQPACLRGRLGNRSYRTGLHSVRFPPHLPGWGKHRITELFFQTSSKNSVSTYRRKLRLKSTESFLTLMPTTKSLIWLWVISLISCNGCDKSKPNAVLETNRGRIVIELYPDVAPKTVDILPPSSNKVSMMDSRSTAMYPVLCSKAATQKAMALEGPAGQFTVNFKTPNFDPECRSTKKVLSQWRASNNQILRAANFISA